MQASPSCAPRSRSVPGGAEIALVAFLALGLRLDLDTAGGEPQYEYKSCIVAGGLGGRFLFRPQDIRWVGADVGRGPED